ncbi:methionyl-tRNA synthetase [Caldisphaera lagunensis DSM 15908]|uniref:Methionine--tRNA ligase n=1 Tax=Caldisphaera lagunensis (strain DSM 15908 / JCM 11604 / ANMR 0165 / IC-154) TaxID=1056495 RepID=L0AD63_CALLD|nr:methionine--tRNA ligase [Caldisphaera lagunensis]AFZ71077.1 methionyl-tRNA synthetase [Caldisphaera lagunensis DSM 15908]
MRYIVASAWPYSDFIPHLGTVLHLLSADVYSRYLRSLGNDVVFVTGSDEHGTPIELEARKRKVTPKELTDQVHGYMIKLFKEFNFEFSLFSRTESEVHKGFVKEFLLKIYEKGYIFPMEEELPYCLNDKMFLPDRYVIGTCPYCGYESAHGDQCDKCGRLLTPKDLINPKCALCGSTPVWRKTTNYFIDLTRVQDKLLNWLNNNNKLSDNVKNYSISWIKHGLKPRSITRDISWGIESPFPNTEGKTIYVWFDALLGYLSATKEYFLNLKNDENAWKEYWKNKETKSIYFIGKDNIPFHSIILPAMLLAAEEDYVLPWDINSTEYLMYEGQKFSKSRKIGVWLDEALKIAPAEYWRWALIRTRPEGGDSNFTWKEFVKIVNNELNDDIGNFIYRVLSLVKSKFNGIIPEPQKLENVDLDLNDKVTYYINEYKDSMDEVRLKKATDYILEIARLGNKYLNDRAPWDLYSKDLGLAKGVIYNSTNIIKDIALLLYPFMPSTSDTIWKQLGYNYSIKEIKFDDIINSKLKSGMKISNITPIFKKLPNDFLENIDKIIEKARDEANSERPNLLKEINIAK